MPGRQADGRGCARRASDRQHLGRRSAARRSLTGLAAVAIAIGIAANSLAAGSAQQATSSRPAREDAIRTIPFAKLDPADKGRITAAVDNASIFRRLPIQVNECDPDLYLFLVRHPEVVVNIWEVMKISNVALERTGEDTFRASDGAGTLCAVKFCYTDHETQVIYAEGSYDGPLFTRPVKAKCVLVLKSGYIRETNGRYYVTSRMDTFVQIEHAGVEMLAKTLQPLVNRAADFNFVETAGFIGTISRTAEANPVGVGRLARKLTNVKPEVRDRFTELVLEIGHNAQKRDATPSLAADAVPSAPPKGAAIERR